jgi:Mg2+ and Co2+ transporter CorA
MTKVTGIIGVTMKNMDVEAVHYFPFCLFVCLLCCLRP